MEHKKQFDGILTQSSTSGQMAVSLAKGMPEVEYEATTRILDQAIILSMGETHLKATAST